MTSGLTGVLHASLEVVARLEAAGHHVTYACPQNVEAKVSAHGFSYVQLPPVNFDPAPAVAPIAGTLSSLRRYWRKIKTVRQRREAGINALELEPFNALLSQLSPDLILLDMELHDHIITAVARRFQVVLLSQWFSIWDQPGLPPISHNTIPGQGWRGLPITIKGKWMWSKMQTWRDIQQAKILSFYTDRRSILRLYARKVGFPLELFESYFWPPPFTYKHLPVLSMTSQALEFPHDPRSSLYYVGPMVLENRKDPRIDTLTLDRLQAIFEEKQTTSRPLIYCSLSTMTESDQAFIQRLLDALAGRPQWMMILSLGGSELDHSSLSFPSNVYPFNWLPQLRVLQQADCSINHGGIHTINECIHFRVPMLVYSGKKFDQNGCAARIAFHRVGIVGDKDQDDVHQIQDRIEKILGNPIFQSKIDDIHFHYKKHKHLLVQQVEQFLHHPQQLFISSK